MLLTDRQIRNAKPASNVYRLRDTEGRVKGFGVTIAPAGSKTFFLGYTSPVTGKRTQINIGRFPGKKLKDARIDAERYREMIDGGIDPRDEITKQTEAQKALRDRGTVEELFDFYISDMEQDGKRSAKEVRRIYNKHIKALIGEQYAADITADHILDVLAPIVRRKALVHADNVRAYLRAAFEFGIHARNTSRWRGKIPAFNLTGNPVLMTKRAVKRKPVGSRTLSIEEIQKIWTGEGLSDASRLALQLLISTGQRVEEVLQASWSEFDLEEKLWIIPAERRKARNSAPEPHIVPLTDFHLELLEKVKDKVSDGTWLFPHRDGKAPRKADGLYQATHRYCQKAKMESFAPRDCRRTFKTLTGSIGLSLEIRNRLQGHAMTDVGSVHYDRWTYLPEKREAMEAWSEWLLWRV